MNDRTIRQDVYRMAGASALLFGALLILQMIAYRVVGADIYAESNWQGTFDQIVGHKALFSISGAAGALAVSCTIPLVVGLWYSLDEADRPFCFVGGTFLLVSMILLLDGYAHYGNLVGTAFDFVHGIAPRDVIIQNGDSIGDQFQILQYAGFVSFGIGLAVLTRLMDRSTFFPKTLVWFTGLVAMSSLLANVLPVLFTVGRLAWVFGMGFTWLRAAVPEDTEEAESVIA